METIDDTFLLQIQEMLSRSESKRVTLKHHSDTACVLCSSETLVLVGLTVERHEWACGDDRVIVHNVNASDILSHRVERIEILLFGMIRGIEQAGTARVMALFRQALPINGLITNYWTALKDEVSRLATALRISQKQS